MQSAIEEGAAQQGFSLAESQCAAARRLSALGAAVAARGAPDRGVYLWGPVGRGKTWLMDRFYEAAPAPSKARFHFQRFLRDFNGALEGRPIGRAAVAAALDKIIGNARVVCFDEFYAHEPGDAALLTRLLDELITARRVPLVLTSNYAPHGLLPDRELRTSDGPVEVSHRAFERGIGLLEAALDVLEIDDGFDYRREPRSITSDAGFAAGRYLVPGSRDQIIAVLGLEVPERRPEPVPLAGGRRAQPLAVVGRCIWFGFDEICGRPVAAGDVLGLASRYTTWVVSDVPRLVEATPEAAQRFVNLVDVLHDADVRLVLGGAPPLAQLLSGEGLPPDAARARSRLSLLRT